MSTTAIRPGEREALLRSLGAGVVPHGGQRHVLVGRAAEVEALVADVGRIAGGGSAARFVIGDFGVGKTFLLHLARSVALERRLVTVHADLNPDRRPHSGGGQVRGLYSELMRNLATRAKPDGGALTNVIERFVSTALTEAQQTGADPGQVIRARLAHLSETTGGRDLAEVVRAYWRGHDTGDEQLKSAAVRWMRAEFSTTTGARSELGVRTIIDDSTVHDHLKLMSGFVRLAGYDGLLVCLDEMDDLCEPASARARDSGSGQILRILDDTLQGGVPHLGFVFAGTPEFLHDHAVLRSRPAGDALTEDGRAGRSGPVLHLAAFTQEDLYVLLAKLRHVHAFGDPSRYLLDDEALPAFMHHCSGRIGETYFRTPRTTIKAFCDLLTVLEQSPGADWRQILPSVEPEQEANPGPAPVEDEESAPAPAWSVPTGTAG